MAAVNSKRVLLGALAGGVVWTLWSIFVNAYVLAGRYVSAANQGHLLKQPRYPAFMVFWIVTLFLLAYIVAWLYASVRATRGAGPGTALQVGLFFGFGAGFPMSLGAATWEPVGRAIPLWWMLDLWIGAILAALVAGYVYKD